MVVQMQRQGSYGTLVGLAWAAGSKPDEGLPANADATRPSNERGRGGGGERGDGCGCDVEECGDCECTPLVTRSFEIPSAASATAADGEGLSSSSVGMSGVGCGEGQELRRVKQDGGGCGLGSKIRFQVVIWYISPVDVVLGVVTMKFRVTIFWNAPSDEEHEAMTKGGYGVYNPTNTKVWTMHGRQRAYQRQLTEIMEETRLAYVPPVSILNSVDYSTMGDPEVCLLDDRSRLMKWTCMYRASLIQEDMRVDDFPHDSHDLVLKLAVLKHRQGGRRWDRERWALGLATEEDSQRTTRVPHGLVVDHVHIPEFHHLADELAFEFVPLSFGRGDCAGDGMDHCLEVKLGVRRDSGYYDKNIIPLLAMLNVVAVSSLALDAREFGNRGQIILATSFAEIGIRLTVDSRLPNVGYQIKMQAVLNQFFFLLLFLTVESSLVYSITDQRWNGDKILVDWIDRGSALLALIHTCFMLYSYYFRTSGPTEHTSKLAIHKGVKSK